MNALCLKTILLAALILPFTWGSSLLLSQSEWAPIGAEWDYGSYLNMYPDQIRWQHYEVEKDTIVEGQACRKLNYTMTTHDGIVFFKSLFTYSENDSIYFYDPDFSDFVLIYDFTAEVGDTLLFNHWNGGYDPFSMRLDEVETIFVDGDTSLTQLKYLVNEGTYCQLYHTVLENIGSLSGLVPYNCLPVTATEEIELRCYRDANIEYSLKEDCDFYGVINSTELLEPIPIAIHPNPANNHLTISSDTKFNRLKIISSIGEEVWKLDKEEYLIQINIQNWPVGNYFIIWEGKKLAKGYAKIIIMR